MDLHEALQQVAMLRDQCEEAPGRVVCYRSATIACGGALAIGTAIVQSLVGSNDGSLLSFLTVWILVAAVSSSAVAIEMVARWRSSPSAYRRQQMARAVGQFSPSVLAAATVTAVMVVVAPNATFLLPGLWSVFFSVGVIASRPYVHRDVMWVGLYYLVSGVVAMTVFRGNWSLSPWSMALCFGVGQLANAFALRERSEPNDA